MFKRLLLFVAVAGLSFSGLAQRGDKAGENQNPLIPSELIPPSPVLKPEEALKSFKVAPGFRVELVAAEPLVNTPVQAVFDPDGRMWVLEMSGFMPNPEGVGEQEPVGAIVFLEDTNSDGQMDKRTVFLDKLVMPRSFLLVRGGVLFSEPPNLWFVENKNGKSGDRINVATNYAAEADPKLGDKANPEHAANSLLWAQDNWIYSANATVRFRRSGEDWMRERTSFRGQWGLCQDDFGRLVYNSNSDQFRMDLVPSHYLTRNANFSGATGANVDPIQNQAVWPIRVTPGINRGYQPGMLRDGKLAKFTAACGPLIYRGDTYPAEFHGNAFVCEPSANLIKRNVFEDRNGVVSGRHAYDKSEFLASTDERFRPVNLHMGPDGNMVVVDMYHGIIQHRYFLTSYLRKQAESRGLDKPNGMGRIYRIVSTNAAPSKTKPTLTAKTALELVEVLAHPNGWWRDTAQQMLVERDDAKALPALRKTVMAHTNSLARLHALWVLHGMQQLTGEVIRKALQDENPKVRIAAFRCAETLIKSGDSALLELLHASAQKETRVDVAQQLALTLGEFNSPPSLLAMSHIAGHHGTNGFVRDAVISGLGGRELDFLETLTKPGVKPTEVTSYEKALARCVLADGDTNRLSRLFAIAAEKEGASRRAIIDGIAAAHPVAAKGKPAPKIKPVLFAAEPPGLAQLNKKPDPSLQPVMDKALAMVSWPGRPNYVAPAPVRALTPEEKKQFDFGAGLYSSSCAACHQAHGNGQEGLAPPLKNSDWVTGSPGRLLRIMLNGVRGPITVNGKLYDMEMPGLPIFDDEQIAALATYVRREWGHAADPIPEAEAKKVRDAVGAREDAWTEAELNKIP